jgi:hypothetical protein
VFGKNQSVQSLASATSRAEAFLKTAGVALGFRVFLSLPIDRCVSQAHHHSSNRTQNPRCSGGTHPALVFPQRNVQAMVQPAFHNPVASLDGEHPLGLELFQSKAAHQINHFTAPFALPLDPRL